MCGIVGVASSTPCKTRLIDGIEKLEYRGYDSAGVAIAIPNISTEIEKAVGAPSVLRAKIEDLKSDILDTGSVGIAHTRWATHGRVTKENAHPHQVGRITLVHNGIIENYAAIKEEYDDIASLNYRSQTDSEILAALLNYFISNLELSMPEALQAVSQKVHGTYGLVVLDAFNTSEIWVARSGSPMVIGLGDDANYVASDVLALNQYTEDFIYLDEGDFAGISANSYQVFNSRGDAITKPIKKLTYVSDNDGHNGYSSFMEKEIAEQPAVIGRLVRAHLSSEGVKDGSELAHIRNEMSGVENIHLIACGTSYNAGLVAKYYFESYLNIPTSVEIASEFRYRSVAVPKNTAFICISQSGETADTLAALRKANEIEYLTTITLCNVSTSSMVREANASLLLQAGVEVGVASTKAFTTQLTAFLLLTLALTDCEQKKAELIEALFRLPADCESVLNVSDDIRKNAAPTFKDSYSCLFLGRGEQFPIAMEGALKLKELSYIHAEAYAAGELKHGPLALIDDVIPVVVNAPGGELNDKLAANVEEVNARGGRFVAFVSPDVELHGDNLVNIRMPQLPEATLAITYAIPLQLLSYHVTVLRGNNVDKPRNLAKSVTVE
jgi:glucosamine--fructose-6-phosphate aminotransferase (isomerizing)